MEALLPRVGAARIVVCAQSGTDAVIPVATSGGDTQGSFESFPVDFAGTRLGVLRAESSQKFFFTPESKHAMEELAAQLAAVWNAPTIAISAAIALDKKMEALKAKHPRFDWCGIYRVEGGTLRLTAFRGAPTPHPVIDVAKGICGAAVRENATINIDDVKSDPRYLSCDLRTRSELVVPIRDANGAAIGEIDIDSHSAGAFNAAVVQEMEQLARELQPLMIKFR